MSETSGVVEFLLARIAEDEEVSRAADGPAAIWRAENWSRKWAGLAHTMRWSPARVLAECEAKRRIVERHEKAHEDGGSYAWAIDDVLGDMASAYSDHPDYDPTWT